MERTERGQVLAENNEKYGFTCFSWKVLKYFLSDTSVK